MQIREYNIKEVVVFGKTAEEFGGLSNMAAGYSLNVNGIIIPSAEHLYQACKFPLFPDIQEAIISENSPITAKMVSRKNNHLIRQDWDNIRIRIMRWVLNVKLSQNWEKFSTLLLETNNKAIVELSYKDKIWGAVANGDNLTGVNALGRLLMETRDKFVKANDYQKCIEPPKITGFMLFGHEIELVCNDSFNDEYYLSKEELEHC